VESDKAVFDVEVDESGVLLEILHQAGEEVEVLKPIAYLGQADERPSSPEQHGQSEAVAAQMRADSEPGKSAAPLPERRRIAASPTARRHAREHGIDLETVSGTGPGGRIVLADIEAAIASGEAAGGAASIPASPAQVSGDTVVPFSRIEQRMADRLTMSKTSIPHFYLFTDVDMTEAAGWRERYNRSTGERITFTDLIIKATSSALVEFPKMNSHVEKNRLVLKADINIGVATWVDAGLLVPVIPHADSKNLQEISARLKKNTEAAKRGVMELNHAGTFTITSLGMHGIKGFVPIINPPQCAILAVGAIESRVVPISGGIGVREMATLILAADHRAVEGVGTASFLNKIKGDLENINEVASDWIRGAHQSRR
jgi:pyruvate dehydrogenase E2 component (dihydrolipoamide acetyltransferase)